MTTHAAFRKNEPVESTEAGSEYSWATDCVGVQLNIFGTAEADRLSVEANHQFAHLLHEAVRKQAQRRQPNSTGWYMHIWPEVVDYQTPAGLDVLGYGIDLKMMAYAGTRQRACDRWKALVSFVRDVARSTLDEGASL